MQLKSHVAWALYDWANSAYATIVMAGFFPIFFKQFWSQDIAATESTWRLGVANSVASLVIVLLAPILGAIADQAGQRKRLLMLFALSGCVMTAGLFWVAAGEWQLAVVLYVVSTIGFMGANIFYDALLINVATQKNYDRVSALGYALGYLGGGLLFAGCVYMTQNPMQLGLPNEVFAVKLSFLLVAVWWAIFSLPLLFFVTENHQNSIRSGSAIKNAWRQFIGTCKALRHHEQVWLFLLAYWLYIDGVDTIIRMAVDYGLSLGFDQGDLIQALLITQFIGFPAALIFGRLGEKIGARAGIFIAIGLYILITLWASQMQQAWEFYSLAVMIGLVQGGIQSLSRSLYARLIPADQAAEFFGFYNMLGKFAAVIGPLMVGFIGVATGNPRLGILSVLVLFILGFLVLTKVNRPADNLRRL